LLYTPLNNAINESVNVSKNDSQGTAEEPNRQNVEFQSIPYTTAEILNSYPGISLPDFEEALIQEREVDEETIKHVVEQTKG
jgi:hypothetical protein